MIYSRPLQTTLVAATGAMLVAGCMTTNPYTGEQQVSKTAKGAGIGAATGAVVGVIAGKGGGKEALIGAGVGAAAGGAIGYYMDRQEALLRQRLQGTGVGVTRVGDQILLNMPGNITFQTDSSDLRPDFFEVLNSVALVLKEFNKTTVEVAGHTDSTGSDEYNQKLSERRAQAVSRYLNSQGLLEGRFWTVGYGEARPLATNETSDGRQRNRRVEIQIVPIQS